MAIEKTLYMNLRKNLLTICMFLFWGMQIFASPIEIKQLSSHAKQYGLVEWRISVGKIFKNPYFQEEVALGMVVVSPMGDRSEHPCFFIENKTENQSVWGARITPLEQGKYSYYLVMTENRLPVYESEKSEFDVKPGNNLGFLYPGNEWVFKTSSGANFRGIGITFGWESRSNDDSKYFKELHELPKYNYEYMLSLITNSGGNYFRTWMCPWNLPLEWKLVSSDTDRYTDSDEHFNPTAIKRMDELTHLCDSLGIYMMLALDQAGGYLGESWKRNNYNVINGGPAQTPYDFFTDTEAKNQYKNRLRYLVSRWGYSCSIGAWEFFNEVDYLAYENNSPIDSIHQAISRWHQEMSEYLKTIDPYKRPITTSISHFDVAGLNSIPHIDFNQKHIYKNTGIIPATIIDYTKRYNKPYVIGEYGYEWDWSKNFNDFGSDMDSDFKRGLWFGLFSPTPILPLSWWWEFFESRGMVSYIKNVRTMQDYIMKETAWNLQVKEVSPLMEEVLSMTIGGDKSTYIYLYNKSQKSQNVAVKINFKAPSRKVRLLGYDCEKGEFFNIKGGRINNEGIMALPNETLEAGNDKIYIIQYQ